MLSFLDILKASYYFSLIVSFLSVLNLKGLNIVYLIRVAQMGRIISSSSTCSPTIMSNPIAAKIFCIMAIFAWWTIFHIFFISKDLEVCMISYHSSGIRSQVSIVPHLYANVVGIDPFAQGTVSNSWLYVFSFILMLSKIYQLFAS